jgi:hypothetical protein
MCLSRKVVDYLERSNERDFNGGRASYETYVRFCDIVDRCHACERFDNGAYGDMLGECRLHVLRVFVSMKRDVEQVLLQRALSPTVTTGLPPQPGPDERSKASG